MIDAVLAGHVLAAIGVATEAGHPTWLLASAALYAVVIALIGAVVSPAAKASGDPRSSGRIRVVGAASSLLVLCIAGLMVVRPGVS